MATLNALKNLARAAAADLAPVAKTAGVLAKMAGQATLNGAVVAAKATKAGAVASVGTAKELPATFRYQLEEQRLRKQELDEHCEVIQPLEGEFIAAK